MTGNELRNLQEAYNQIYSQLDERIDPEERALRRAEVADKKASRMDSKVASKYASSEARSAERADKKSRGKHIHGTVDEGTMDIKGFEIPKKEQEAAAKRVKEKTAAIRKKKGIEEAVYGGEKKEPEDKRMIVTAADKKANTPAWKKYQAGDTNYRAASHLTKEEMKLALIAHLKERALDAAEKREKESVYKAIKPSKLAKTYPEKSPEELKSLRYAISTSQAKKNMDTSRSDKRYGIER